MKRLNTLLDVITPFDVYKDTEHYFGMLVILCENKRRCNMIVNEATLFQIPIDIDFNKCMILHWCLSNVFDVYSNINDCWKLINVTLIFYVSKLKYKLEVKRPVKPYFFHHFVSKIACTVTEIWQLTYTLFIVWYDLIFLDCMDVFFNLSWRLLYLL